MTRRRRGALIAALVVVAAAAIAPFACDREHLEMDAAARAKAPGSFAKLTDGTTHYEITGPEAGPPVVLVHGVSGPMTVWDALAPRLAAAGYRVLRYDHFGRGYSDRAHVDHDSVFYERQLIELLYVVDWREPITVIGSSMGAIVATELALRHPDRVARLVLIGPAGFPIEAGFGAKLLQVPALGAYLMRVLGDRNLSSHHRDYFVEPAKFEEAQAAFEAQLEINGTKRSIRSTMMNMPINGFGDGYRKLGASKKPVLLVWGREDQTFPYANHVRLQQLVPQAKLVTIEAAAHLPQLEQVDAVLAAILEVMRATPSTPPEP